MARDPAFLFYPGDFLIGCSDLTMEERGQYITLLCLEHQKGRLTEKTIRLTVGSVSVDVLKKFAKDENGNIFNERLELEIAKRMKFVVSRRENGKLGGRPPKPTGKLKKTDRLLVGSGKNNLMEDINKDEDTNNKKTNVPFSEFWDLYNYKKNIEECEKLWNGEKKTKHGLLFNDEARKTIMDYLPLFIQRTFKSHYPPRPYPHSFLFQHQWLDEIPEVQTSSGLGSRRTSAPQEGEDKYADL